MLFRRLKKRAEAEIGEEDKEQSISWIIKIMLIIILAIVLFLIIYKIAGVFIPK